MTVPAPRPVSQRAALFCAPLALLPLLSALLAQPPATLPAPDPLATDLNHRLTADVAPLLATYCVTCHNPDTSKGDVNLSTLQTLEDALTDFDLRKVKEMVATGAMPPDPKPGKPDNPKPTDHQRLTITQWIDAALNYTPADAPIDPGWFTIHRLNRAEYRNTLRDLLGIDPAKHDLAARLPRDDTGYGFDNVADVLSVSPLAVEQYLAAAERAIHLALGPVVEFGDHPKNLRPLSGSNGQPLPKGGFFLYSAGAATGTFNAPLTGDYLVRVVAFEDKAGDEHANLSLRDGKKTLKDFAITASRGDPQTISHRVRLTAGEHTIAAHFTNDYYVKDKADRNLGVESISIAGPLDEKTAQRPAQHAAIFAPAAKEKSEESRAAAVLNAFASRAYRRPATTQQTGALLKVYKAQRKAGQEFEPALRTALAAALVSPNFLFRAAAVPKGADRYTLDGYELASRLSYFLWSSMPDEPLLAAAADGSLLTDQGLRTHTRRMLADPRSKALIENFAGQWLQLRNLESIAIDRAAFPDYTDQLRTDMVAETTLFLKDILDSNRSLLDLIDSNDTFLNARLAKLYGIDGVKGDDLRRVTLPESARRGGVLTMASVLTLTSNTNRTSPVKRGLFVLDELLNAPPPPPPADIPPLDQAHTQNPNATVRERLIAHTANPTCASCHTRLDPLGFALEHYDAIGRWRDTENGKPIDSTGKLPDGTNLAGADDLKRTLLARSDQFIEALTAKLLTYATGRGTEPFDRPAIRQIAQQTRTGNGDQQRADKLATLIASITTSQTFRTCRPRSREQ